MPTPNKIFQKDIDNFFKNYIDNKIFQNIHIEYTVFIEL